MFEFLIGKRDKEIRDELRKVKAALKAEIERLNNSPGSITPEDQAILDGILARTNALGDSVRTLADATPDQPPPTP